MPYCIILCRIGEVEFRSCWSRYNIF